jgi:hypothetical protein
VAHPKIIQRHKIDVHNPRVKKLMMSLQTPEDIAKYREQRRKNFPTKENKEKKVKTFLLN